LFGFLAQTMDDFKRRDYLVCCVIGALFIGSFLAIESRVIQSMIIPQKPTRDWLLLVYSVTHISIFTILSIIKIVLSKKLNSKSLMADALNSIIGIIMAIPLILWDRIASLSKHAQFDDIISVLMALFLLVIGCKLVHSGIAYHNRLYFRSLNRESIDANANTALMLSGQPQVVRSTPEDTHKQFSTLDKDAELAEAQ
jgi:Co/Zn/Cd efflux system component